jgi:competence protein ComEC
MQKGVVMGIIYRRPIVSFCIMMILGITAAFLSNSTIFVICLFTLFAVILFTSCIVKDKGRVVAAIMLAFFLLGACESFLSQKLQTGRFERFFGEEAAVRGYIDSAPEIKGGNVSYTVRVCGIRKGHMRGFEDVGGKILLKTPADSGESFFDYGTEVIFEGMLIRPSGVRNPGGFDYRMYLAQKGVGATLFAYPNMISKGDGVKGNFLIKAGLAIRKRIVYVIEKSLPEQQAGLLNGMLIGYREGLSDEVRSAFSDAGLMHIMAVSGANVAFLIAPVSLLLKLLGIRKKAANILIMAFLTLFVCVTGFEPSVLRAVFMACVVLASVLIYREPDVYSAIAVPCIIMLAINPAMIFNIGFQLSYAATVSLVMLYPNISRMITCRFIPKKAAGVLGATLAAQAGVLPVTMIHFNKVSLISVMPNILAAPLLELITILGAIMAVVGQFSIFLSRLVGYLNNIFLTAVLYITKWSAAVPYATVRTVTPSLAAAVLYYAVVWFLLWYRPLKGIRLNLRHFSAALTLTALLCLTCSIKPGSLEVVFLDVGQGDSTFIRTCTGKTILIDGGGSTNPDKASRVGELTVVPFLLDHGTGTLDAVIATHAHADHIQGLTDVLEMIRVRRLIIPSLDDEECFGDLLAAAQRNGVPVSRCSGGEVIRIDNHTAMHVLNPEANCTVDKETMNNTSLVMKLCYEETSVLFTGDAETEVEERLVAEAAAQERTAAADGAAVSVPPEALPMLEADVIKIGHHGSDTSTSEAFLAAVDPEAAIISTGKNNFGHPSPKVLELLSRNGVEYFRTDECGAVLLESDGRKMILKRTVY